MSSFTPVQVATIDLERCPETIDSHGEHAALWALMRRDGRPVGVAKLEFHGERLRRDEIVAAAGPLLRAPVPRSAAGTGASASVVVGPMISVVVPSMFGRLAQLRACVASLTRLDYPRYEVIVVDNRPAGAPAIALEGARVVRETRPGISAARNRGLAEARGEIIAFTDDDVVVDPGWLAAIARRFAAHPEEACVTGLTFPSQLETPAQIAIEDYYGGFGVRHFEPLSHRLRRRRGLARWLTPATVDAVTADGAVRASFSLYATGSFGHGANMAVRASALRELGGFDLALGTGTPTCGGEDLALFAQLVWHGAAIGFEPAALVHHAHRADDAGLRTQIEGYGIGWGAMLLALICGDPRHLGPMLATLPRGLRALAVGFARKLQARATPQPGVTAADSGAPTTQELARLELAGIARSPLRYLRGRWSAR